MEVPKTMRAIHLPLSKAYSYSNPCRAASLVLSSTFPTPIPNAKQALICIHATAISPYELTWEGTYTLISPRIPCFDIAGTIVSAPSQSDFVEGDRVFGLLNFVEACSLPRAALTAWQAVKVRGVVREGMRVLFTGASGAVGRMGIQILREVVAEKGTVIAIGGNGTKGLKELGADVVVDYRETRDWEAAVGKVDWAFDCVGGKTLERCLRIVKSGGQVVTIGSPPPIWESVKGWDEAKKRGVDRLFFIVEENGEQLVEVRNLVRGVPLSHP